MNPDTIVPRSEPDLPALGQFIRERRTAIGLTQTQLAQRIGWVQERVSLLENAKYGMPSLPGLAQLADALETPLTGVLHVVGYAVDPLTVGGDGAPQSQVNVAMAITLQQLLEIDPTTLQDALAKASDLMAMAMGADKIDAFVHEPSSQTLVALGTSNTPMGRLQHEVGLERLPLANHGRTVQVFESGEPFCTGDARNDEQIAIGIRETLGVRSMLCVPFRIEGAIVGVLSASSAEPDRFRPAEQRFFTAAERWISMVAHRAQLAEALRSSLVDDARRVAADDIIAALAHDLGNMLTPLKGRLDILTRRLQREGQEADVTQVQEAQRSVAAMRALISRLLDSTRLDEGLFSLVMQPIDLPALVEAVAESMRPSWSAIEVRTGGAALVHGDPTRLREALVNLLTNAVQHSPEGAPITMTLHTERRESGLWALIAVTDLGPGIAPDILPRIFERFSSGSGSFGLGLGLYLSRRLVEAHGGTLTAESTLGSGTTFMVALPVLSE
jgi:signal transduction histidine kinase/transcriptional regulator with XRE-family HTH domain